MKNTAFIIAGVSGERMHQDIPKQFIYIEDKHVFICTLEEIFQDIIRFFCSCYDKKCMDEPRSLSI